MERVFVALLALFIASSVFANNIDSLNNAANRLDNSIEKVELLIQLSELTISGDQLKSIKSSNSHPQATNDSPNHTLHKRK